MSDYLETYILQTMRITFQQQVQIMPVTCEGCGAELEHWNAEKKEWYLVSTGRPHTVDTCPGKEKLLRALKEKREKAKITDPNIRFVKIDDGLVKCRTCGATYSENIDQCPGCKRIFIKGLFK